MANANDIKFLGIATRLLDKFGTPGVLTLKSEGELNPYTGEVTLNDSVISVPKVSPPVYYTTDDIDGVLVVQGDYKLYVARSDSVTSLSVVDSVSINGLVADVIKVSPYYSGEEIAAWELQCRSQNKSPQVIKPVEPTRPPNAPANTLAPTIDTKVDDATLIAFINRGDWTGHNIVFTYQWYSDAILISGATREVYTVQPADLGTTLTCDITGTGSDGDLTVTTVGYPV